MSNYKLLFGDLHHQKSKCDIFHGIVIFGIAQFYLHLLSSFIFYSSSLNQVLETELSNEVRVPKFVLVVFLEINHW